MAAICRVTNGTEYISLIGDVFYIDSWNPSGTPFKNDGYWQDSVFADGRRLAQYTVGNATETITISQRSLSQNAAIRQINKLARLFLDAAEFSTKPKHGRKPVYLEVKASSESNTRYAQIHAGQVGEYGNPFSQPFLQPGCRAAVTNVNLVIERGPWLELPPGMDTCQEIAPTGTPGEASYYTYQDILLGNAPTSVLQGIFNEGRPIITWPAFALWKLNETSGSVAANSSQYPGLDGVYDTPANVDSLRFWNVTDASAFMSISDPNVDIYSIALNQRFNGNEGSLLAWVNTSGLIWTGGNDAYFVNIQVDSDTYLRIYHPGTVINNSVQWEYAANGTAASWREDDFSPADEWFSIGMTWSQTNLGFPNVRFYLNGGLVAYRLFSGTWTGNLSSTLTVIGQSDNTGTDGGSSDMAWVALWNAPLTDDDMALIGVPNFGFVEATDLPCDEIVAYVANKNNTARLTHAFTHDASPSAFGSNIIVGTPPFALLPGTIAVNDAMYFGIQTSAGSGLPAGPFNSVVLDIATAALAAGGLSVQWEYWDGSAWSSLSVIDNTDGFQETGINSVHWVQPDDWATNTVNGVTAYWVRVRVTAVSGAWTQPIAQDAPYTIVRNVIDVPDSATGGSLPSLARLRLDNTADPIAHDENMAWERVLVGLRSHDLAPNFSSYINLSDRQNPQGITVSVGTNASFQTDTTAASGRSIRLVGGGTATLIPRWTVTVDYANVPSYLGSYKVFVLYTVQGLGVLYHQSQLRVKAGSGYNHIAIDTGPYIVSAASPAIPFVVHEVGEVTIRPDTFTGDSLDVVEFSWWSVTDASLDVDFYALVLIPTDEWFGDFGTDPNVSSNLATVAGSRYLSIDSTRYLNRAVVADVRETDTDLAVGRWKQSHNGQMRLQPSGRQLLHFLFMRTDAETTAYYAYGASPHAAGPAKVYRNRAYNYGRGDE